MLFPNEFVHYLGRCNYCIYSFPKYKQYKTAHCQKQKIVNTKNRAGGVTLMTNVTRLLLLHLIAFCKRGLDFEATLFAQRVVKREKWG